MSDNGLAKLLRNMDKIEKELLKSGAKGLENGLILIAKQSLKETPVDTGALRESMVAEVNGTTILKGSKSGIPIKAGNVKEKAELKAEMGYGGTSDTKKYAEIQHENLSFRHPVAGTKAKYLEDPFKANRNKVIEAVTKEIKKVTK